MSDFICLGGGGPKTEFLISYALTGRTDGRGGFTKRFTSLLIKKPKMPKNMNTVIKQCVTVMVIFSNTRLLTERKVVERRPNKKDPQPIHQQLSLP